MKSDFKKLIDSYTAPHGEFALVTVPPMTFLMIDGHGDPNTAAVYADSLATLYPIAYKLKFLSKNELGRDYTVMPLEALWSATDMDSFTTARDKSRWSWTLMNMVPEWIAPEHFEQVRQALTRKGGVPLIDSIRFERLAEGLSVQTLHIGAYDDEAGVLQRMHGDFIPANSLTMTGKHHEIYLSDPRRSAPEKLRTILRQPVAELPEAP